MALPSDDIAFFVTLASARSLTEAARHWGVSVAMVSRRLAALERRLGVRLAVRGARGLSLTPEGERYRARGKDVLQAVADLEASVRPDQENLSGLIRVVATVGLGRSHIAPLVRDFHVEHPQVEISLELTSLPLSAAVPGFDLAVRVGEVPDSGLRLTRLAENRRILVASPQYIARRGTPHTLEELRHHDCLLIKENDGEATWRFLVDGQMRTVPVSGPLTCNDGLAVMEWCVRGDGIALRSRWHVDPLLAAGRLVQVLPDVVTPSADIFALTSGAYFTPPRVTALVDYLRRRLPERIHPTEGAKQP